MAKNYWKLVNDVIRDADIILEVIDARLIEQTRNKELEAKVHKAGKALIYVLNKIDLITDQELERAKHMLRPSVCLSAKEHHGTTVLRRMILRHAKTHHVIVGVVGYPNTGKSSLINALKGKHSARTSPESGFTKGIQLIRVSERIKLMDTPGVLEYQEKNIEKLTLIGAIDATKVKDPEEIAVQLIEVLDGLVEQHYGVEKTDDAEQTLETIALKMKKLKKGGVADVKVMGRLIIAAWQKGKIKAEETPIASKNIKQKI